MSDSGLQRYADLHLHTNYSDGTYSPEQLVRSAKRHGLSIISVTDHDTVEACEAVASCCKSENLGFIPGIELTAEHGGQELHLLGYYMDLTNAPLLEKIACFQWVRQERIRKMVDIINSLDVPLRIEDVLLLANCRSPGRLHVGRALVKGGFCSSQEDAFDRFLRKNRPAWVPKFKISAEDAIRLIHDAGGMAVMAHPGLNQTDDYLPAIIEAGLDGIECFHSKHSKSATQKYLTVSLNHGLIVTGGSDCHGASKGKASMGSVRLPEEYIKKIELWGYSRNLKKV